MSKNYFALPANFNNLPFDWGVEMWHRPMFVLQGDEAVGLIDLDAEDSAALERELPAYFPDEDPELVEGSPPVSYNYVRIVDIGGRTYQVGYTSGYGGLFAVYEIVARTYRED